MLKQFNKNFGVSTSVEEEQKGFINRTNHFLQEIRHKLLSKEDYYSLFATVCVQLGLNPQQVIDANSFMYATVPDLKEILPSNFLNSLKLITAVRSYYQKTRRMTAIIDENIEAFISLSSVDLGITYRAGMFFPKGEELLDKELVEYALNSLDKFPNENKDLQNALENYRGCSKYGVVENCYRCIEGFARGILKNNKTLIDNKAELIKSSGLSEHWKKILANYIDYGNEYGRHASAKRHDFNEAEVEAYLYTTCLLIRLIGRIRLTLS